MTQSARSIDDATIYAGLAKTSVGPEYVEWWGNPEQRVTVRIETTIGKYVDGDLDPWMDADDVADKLRSLSRRLTEEHR